MGTSGSMFKSRILADYLLPMAIFVIPFGFISVETGVANLSAPNILIILTFVAFTAFEYRRKEIRLTNPQITVITIFGLLIVHQVVGTLIHSGSPRRVVTFGGYFLFTTAIFLYVDSERDLQWLLHAAFLSAVLISVLTIIHIFFLYPNGFPFGDRYRGMRTVAGITLPFQRSLGVDMTYGSFGMYVMAATPYYTYIGLKKRSKGCLLGVATVLFAVLLSQSRSTWVAAGGATAIVIVGYLIKIHKPYFREMGIVIGAFGILSSPLIARILIQVRPDTFTSRLSQYRSGIEIAKLFPLFGAGFGNLRQFYQGPHDIHSAFVNLTTRTGIPSLLLVLGIWVIVLLFLLRGMHGSDKKYAFAIALLASLCAVFIESNFQPGFTKTTWVVLALALSTYQLQSNQTPNAMPISERTDSGDYTIQTETSER